MAKEKIDMRASVEIELDFPVQLADRRLEKVTIRRPVMRDMIKHNINASMTMCENLSLLADLCCLVPEEMEQFDTSDFEKLQNQLLSFRGVD